MIEGNARFVIEEFGPLSDLEFGYDEASIAWVEGFIDRQRARIGSNEIPSTLVSTLGSYLGEAIIANAGGTWHDIDEHGIGILFSNGDVCFPFAKVQKQFESGTENGESIVSFYNVSINLIAKGGLSAASRQV